MNRLEGRPPHLIVECYIGRSQSCMGYRAAGQARPTFPAPQQRAGPPV